MFNRLNVLIDTINKQAVTINQLTEENKKIRQMYNDKAVKYYELTQKLRDSQGLKVEEFLENFYKE